VTAGHVGGAFGTRSAPFVTNENAQTNTVKHRKWGTPGSPLARLGQVLETMDRGMAGLCGFETTATRGYCVCYRVRRFNYRSPANRQSNHAKRMECAELAPAFLVREGRPGGGQYVVIEAGSIPTEYGVAGDSIRPESGSKLHALHALREVGMKPSRFYLAFAVDLLTKRHGSVSTSLAKQLCSEGPGPARFQSRAPAQRLAARASSSAKRAWHLHGNVRYSPQGPAFRHGL